MTHNPASVAGYMALQQIAKALLGGAALPTGISEGEHVELGVRSSSTDNLSRYDSTYRWPWPGNWTPVGACNASNIECARGLHVAYGWQAMSMGPVRTIQTVAVRPEDICYRGKTKMRACQAAVLNIVHTQDLADHGRLAGADLREINLNGAVMARTNFNGTNFAYADLRYINLSSSRLEGANLSCTQLDNAVLVCARLQGATMHQTCMFESNLSYANLAGAKPTHANFRGANLRCADFTGAYLIGADFRGANLKSVDFSGADLRGAIFDHAIYAQFGSAAFSQLDQIGVKWSRDTRWPDGYEPPTQNGANHE